MFNKRILQEMKKLEKIVDKEQKKDIRKIGRQIKKNYRSIDRELIKLFKQYSEDGELNYSQLVYDGKQIELEYKVILESVKMYAEIQRVTRDSLKNVADTTVKHMKNIKEVPAIKKPIPTDHIINKDMAGLDWLSRSNGARDKFIMDLQQQIREGLERGTRVEVMSKELADKMSTELYKAERIVRTEGHRIMNDTKLQSFQQINETLPIKKKWVSMGDERVRSQHSALDGQVVGIDENFKSETGGEGLAPGNLGTPEDDINCRCIMTMVLDKK